MVVGSRFTGDPRYRGTFPRRVGIRIFAALVSLIVRQRLTDTTSGFRAVNRHGIRLFALDYPHDYPEVEATVLLFRHRLRMIEVPVHMRDRETGRSSITALRSIYYMAKVSLALFVGLFRRYPTRRRHPRADPQAAIAGALRVSLAGDGRDDVRARALARWARAARRP